MKRLRLIACDLDRTLLREDKTLSPYTLSVLERCRALGILFVPATARPPRTLEGLIPSLTYDGALCHNGGVALFGGKIMWEQGIASDLAARLLLQFQEEFPGTTISAEMGGELYANFPAETIWKDIAYHRSDFPICRAALRKADPWTDCSGTGSAGGSTFTSGIICSSGGKHDPHHPAEGSE